jgi:hypothetical protein
MGLNQALGQSTVGKKTAGMLMQRGTNQELYFRSSNELLNHMADLRLVSKPDTWSIKLDKVYISKGDDGVAYQAVPDKAFAGKPIIPPTANGAEYIGLKCKYTGFEIHVKFTVATALIRLNQSGDFAILEDLINKQVEVTRAQQRFGEARILAIKNKSDLSAGDDARRARAISEQFIITEAQGRAQISLAQMTTNLDDFIAKNKTLADLRDDPKATKELLSYYRDIKATTNLSVSLEISRQQNINGQVVKIPFWYPVIP